MIDLSKFDAKCGNTYCNGVSCAVPACKKHVVYVETRQPYHHETIEINCKYCTLELTVEVPEYIPQKQRGRYAFKIAERINASTIYTTI